MIGSGRAGRPTPKTVRLSILLIAIATSALAGDDDRSRRPSPENDRSNRGIIGGRAVGSDHDRPYSYRPYGHSTYGYRRSQERTIVIERDLVPRGRWRR